MVFWPTGQREPINRSVDPELRCQRGAKPLAAAHGRLSTAPCEPPGDCRPGEPAHNASTGRIAPALLTGAPPLGLESCSTLVIQVMDLGLIVPLAFLAGVLLLK